MGAIDRMNNAFEIGTKYHIAFLLGSRLVRLISDGLIDPSIGYFDVTVGNVAAIQA